ncbi:hypothetical protein RhiirA4_469969 [Rhizophagus irregularis]|uniref:Uncharacterized protein n=1 Tax=Rhizophagus irregularis TaxID=588596 RepID=A0A2I1H0F3_9GLOM|nr:hypothetical protein RhiirA4_469969 [Rhizophagus irregularis]
MEASTSSTPVPLNDITSSDQLIPTVAPFNPIPIMFVPMKYRNIIPSQSIYNDKDRLKCSNLEQENREQYHKERNEKNSQNKADASFHGTSQMNKFTKRESKCKNDEHREKLNKENEKIYQEVSWDHTVQIGLDLHHPKHIRPSPDIIDNSLEAGPSKS